MWIFLSLLGALSQTIQQALLKKSVSDIEKNSYLGMCLMNFFAAFLVLSFNYQNLFGFFKEVKLIVVLSIIILVCLNVLAQFFVIKALKYANLSFLMPFASLTVIINIIPSYLFLNEIPNFWGFLGIILIIVDLIWLTKTNRKSKKSLKNIKGLYYFLLTLGCWSLAPVFWKLAGLNSSPSFTTFLCSFLVGVCWFVFVLVKKESTLKFQSITTFSLAGIFLGLGDLSIAKALVLAQPAYVYTLKRTSAIFAFFISYLFFKERENALKFFLGSILVFIGLCVIVLYGGN